jgi:hypothetical protein
MLWEKGHKFINFLFRKVINNVTKIDDIRQVNIKQLFRQRNGLSLIKNVDLSCIKNSFFLPLHGVQLRVQSVSEELNFGLESLLDIGVDAGAIVVVFCFVE